MDVLLGVVLGLLGLWLVLLAGLFLVRPRGDVLSLAVRLLPDVLRLVTRLARDPGVPRSVRVRLWLLLGYLALPFDLVPDFIPVLGYADDVIAVAWVLRSAVRAAGPDVLASHWPGTPEGLAVVRRLAGVRSPDGE
ncbi:DUF1232 domain-containing protein [Actinosynnema sp. NPDC023658]|uniref:YkvA family protein n=1 Tax=Actinosynnema sp. NPDC023658 TaxID=3155465 RepID=UPI0034039C28